MTSGGHTCSIFRSLHLIIGNALIHEMHSAVINSPQHTGHQQGNDEQSGIIKCGVKVLRLFLVPLPYFSMSEHLVYRCVCMGAPGPRHNIALELAICALSFPITSPYNCPVICYSICTERYGNNSDMSTQIVPTLMGRPQVDTHGCVSLCVSKKLRFVVVLSSPYLQGMDNFDKFSRRTATIKPATLDCQQN